MANESEITQDEPKDVTKPERVIKQEPKPLTEPVEEPLSLPTRHGHLEIYSTVSLRIPWSVLDYLQCCFWDHADFAIALYAVIAAPTSLECVANVPADRLWIGYRAARARKREETIKNKSDGEKANKTDSEEAAEAKKNDPEETAKANKTNHEEAAEAKKNDPEETAKANKSDHEEAATVSNTDSEKEAESEKSK
ncbi:hypothetical protein Tco_1441942 [Tanacetum coccineum]